MFDFPKADPVPRGCGEREPGGVYAECGLSPWGRPLEELLIDPPLPIPDGLDIINKPTLWQRTDASGQPVLDAEEMPIYDLLIWVGEEFYPYCPDYIEEVRRFGASRRLNPNLDLSLLSSASRMILAHPRARNLAWQTQRSPETCAKGVPGHAHIKEDSFEVETTEPDELPLAQNDVITHSSDRVHAGPCLFKLWELIPREVTQVVVAALDPEPPDGASRSNPAVNPLCLRSIGSTTYQYRPTGESTDGLAPGIFATLPITSFAFIRFADGSVNERAKAKVLAGLEAHGDTALPFYESDR